jgi:hypothetical protein
LKNILNLKNMGHIKEPIGVDFIIKSDPLTDKERKAISEFISNYKKTEKQKTLKKATTKKKLALA